MLYTVYGKVEPCYDMIGWCVVLANINVVSSGRESYIQTNLVLNPDIACFCSKDELNFHGYEPGEKRFSFNSVLYLYVGQNSLEEQQ